MTDKITILVLLCYYLPGYKGGGPLRTIVNMVDHLNDEFEFWIVTRDRDLGDSLPYADILPNQWQQVGDAMVYYLPPENCTVNKMAELIAGTQYDVMYLNSFFEPAFTIKPLLARKLGWFPNKPVIIAPRGEFSTGAIKLKFPKKILYIRIAKLFNLFGNVIWQASSEHEAQDIVNVLNEDPAAIHIALDLPACAGTEASFNMPVQPKVDGSELRIVFLSRISPKKNLDYALRVLCKVTATVVFDIYGPTEDLDYWESCTELMKQLPPNVKVHYFGSVPPDLVAAIFGDYHLFFFPTAGENYGHVIAEALSAGTPVLLSDQTPWRDLQTDRMGWDLPLDDMEQFARIIDVYSDMAPGEKIEWRKHILSKIVERLNNPQVFEANRALFRRAIQIK